MSLGHTGYCAVLHHDRVQARSGVVTVRSSTWLLCPTSHNAFRSGCALRVSTDKFAQRKLSVSVVRYDL